MDCGIIYATDAASAKFTVIDTATEEMCGQVIYPAAVLNITKNQEAAQTFLDYLTGMRPGPFLPLWALRLCHNDPARRKEVAAWTGFPF